ncbi:uncharacterized protein LOC110681772 [Chenopodium quinoa]|uniref:uncharacterized protein LOC110681772 n=1 Tax=Chenopodium quinoa TaxID=63459 RepID=UPI000B793DAC|nr:uncharacterized protein LOC110681772 [Chenopodium quinoa]
MEDPLKIRNNDNTWLCEDCDIEFGKPTRQLKRTSSRVTSLVQKASLRKARKGGKNYKDIQDFTRQNHSNTKRNTIDNSKDCRNQAILVKLMTDIYMDSSSPQCSKDVKSPASTISTENNMRLEFEHEYKNLHFDDDVNTLVEDEEYDNESFSCSYEEQKDIVQHNESDDGTSKVYHQEKSSNLVKRKFEDCFHENDSEELDNTENSKNSSYHEICDEHNESKNIGKKLILEKNFGELNDLKPKPSNLDSVNISAYCPPNISATRNFGATAVFQSIPNVLAQPIIDISWRGRCGMICNLQHITLGITAHLSNTASLKVHGATSVLPQELIFKLVPKQEVWPKAFEASPPMTADIALYFFPSEERF